MLAACKPIQAALKYKCEFFTSNPMANQNLLNEIAQLTDNRVQLEKVLASLPGDNYSQEEAKNVLYDLKAQAKADYQRLDANLGINQATINITIDKFSPLVDDLSTSLNLWNKNKDSKTSLEKDVAGLTEKVTAIQKSQSDSSAFYDGEIQKINQKINDEYSRFNNSSVVQSNPIGGLLDSPTYIQEIIDGFNAARNNADSRNKHWESQRQYWVSEYQKFAAKKQWTQASSALEQRDLAIQRRDIFADFLNRFNNVVNTLTILKGVSQANDSYISNGVKPSQFDAYKDNIQNASRIYSTDLVNLYQGIVDKINNQKEKGLIDVQENITKYIQNREVFVYKENADLQGDILQKLLNDSTSNSLDSVKNDLIAAHQKVISGYQLEIQALSNSRFVRITQLQKSLDDTNFQLNQKKTDISQKQNNFSTLSPQIEAKNQEIQVLYSFTYQDLLVKNGKIAEDWKQLLRNESHYFLDEAELHLYQDAYNDFNKQAEKINTLNQKLGSIQNLGTDLALRDFVIFRDYIGNKIDFDNVLNRLLSDNQTFYQVLKKNIIWAKDRQETIALIGSSNQKALAGLIVEIDNLIKDGVSSSLPLSVLSSNLRKIQSDRNNLLTSYDNLQAKISEINLWLQQCQSFGSNSSKDQQIKDNYLIQLQVAKSGLSIFPLAQVAVNKIDSNFKQETGELTSNWNQSKTLFDELITLGANKNSKIKDLEGKNKSLTDLEKHKTSSESQKNQLEEQIKNNLDLITSLTQQIKIKDAEITSAENFLTTLKNLETTAKDKVDTYVNAEGGFFKWENGQIELRRDRIANYREALNEYYLAKKNVATQEVLVKTLKSQQERINNQKTNLENNRYQDQAKLEELNQKIWGVSGLVKQIETSKTEITALENDLKTINQGITDKSLSFLSQIANTGTEFQDIGWTLKIEDLLGEKLLGLGLLITQSDINFFAEEVKPTVEEFIKAIANRVTDLQGLNSPLNSLVSNVDQQDYTKIDPLVKEFVKSFQKLLNKQKQDLQTWQTEQKEVPGKFQDSYETAQDKVGEILLWRRIQTEAELGNIEEVISILDRRLVIGETTADLILDKSPVQASKLNQLITEQVVLDIKSQENLLKEADSFNRAIDKDVIFLKGLATKLFDGFDLSLSKVLSDYLRDKQKLTQGIDIKAILSDRLTAIENSVDSVQDAIDLFQQKINSQGDLLQKIQGISKELELSEKSQDFLKVKNLLGDQDNLNLSNLNQGVNDLKSLLQFLLTKKDSFSTELNQSLTANIQKLDSINALTNELKTFADREKQIEDKLVEIAGKSADLLQRGIDNGGLTNEKKELYFFSEQKPEEDQEQKTVIDKIISGKIKPENIGNIYFTTPEADTWEKIQEFARNIGGNLVTINSEGEQQFILRHIFAATPTGKIEAGTQYWIGYTDKTKEGQWGWVSGQSNGFENWGDRDNGSKLDYAYINRFGLWQTASGEKKLRGIIELDLNSLTIEQLRLESERTSLYADIKDYLDKHSPDYKSILASLTSAETALNKLLADAGIGDLNVSSVIGTIRDKYQESSEFFAEIDSDIKARKASAEAHIKTAEFYEKSAQEYLGKHKELRKTLKDELGFDLPDDAISTETRNTYTRGLLGKKEISVQITHFNSYWLYYEDFTNRAKGARKSAYKILGRDGDLDNPQYNLNIAESLNDQLLKAQAVNSAWKIANDQANVVEGRLNQLRSLINVINLGNVQSQEYQNAINNLQTLLPDLKNQLTEAQQKATNAYQTIKQQWSDFNQSADQLQQVYNELIPLKSQYKAENLSLLGKLEDAKTWVTQKRQSLALQLESVNDARTRLDDFINSPNPDPSIQTILNGVQKLLIHNESLLKDRLAALGEHEEALDAQQTLLLKELELVDAYFDNGGREYSLLRQELEQAQNSLQELQLLAQEALDSSTILTKNIDQITIYLDSVNDEYLDSVKDSHDTLKDLVNSLNLAKGKFDESKQVIDNINTAESDISKLLQKIKDNGETRVTKILEMAKLRGLAVAADIFWQDFTDLLSDTGNFFAGGIATPEDKKLAKSFRKELMTQRTLKRSAEVDANQAGLAIKQAQAQQAVLDAKIKESQASYDKMRSEIADLNKATEAQQATLQKLQLRQAALERLQDVTTGIIKSLLDIQQVNLKLAELEIRYAESFASDINGNTARQIALEAVALNYQKQRLATQVEIYQRADIESTLQDSLIEIGRNLGLEITPIVEASNNQEAIIDLQEQIDRLQKSPLLPDDIQQLLNKVNQDLNDALAGKEASSIEQNLQKATDRLITQQNEYQKSLAQLQLDAQEDETLFKNANTDLQTAIETLWIALQTREGYLVDRSILSDQTIITLSQVRQAQNANVISTELAQQARVIFADILKQRQIEREARRKTLFDFILEATGTVISVASSIVTAGASLARLVGAAALKTSLLGIATKLAVANSINSAVTSLKDGNWVDAIYYAAKAYTGYGLSYLQSLEETDAIIKQIDQFKRIEKSLSLGYSAFNSAKAGKELGAFLDGIAGVASYYTSSLSGKWGSFFDKTIGIPKSIYNSVNAFQDGSWLDGVDQISDVLKSLGSTLEKSAYANISMLIDKLDTVNDINVNIIRSIESSDLTGWINGAANVIERLESYNEYRQEITKFIDKNTLLQSGFSEEISSLVPKVSFQILNGELVPGKELVILCGGFGTAAEGWIEMAVLYKNRADVNVMVVDWSDLNGKYGSGQAPFNYLTAQNNTLQVARALDGWLQQRGISKDSVTWVGHSLGAHIGGAVGGFKDIIALDPAGPGYDEPLLGQHITDIGQRLDKSDATRVFVISSDPGKFISIGSILGGHGLNLGSSNHDLATSKEYYIDITELNKYYPNDSHGDSISFFNQFISSKINDIAIFKNLLEKGQILKDTGRPQTYRDVQEFSKILQQNLLLDAKLKGKFSEEVPSINVGRRTFAIDVNYKSNAFSQKQYGSNELFDVKFNRRSLELTPKFVGVRQGLEIENFQQEQFDLEVSNDAGKIWQTVTPFTLNGKYQPLTTDLRYRVTPKGETAQITLDMRLSEVVSKDDLPVIILAVSPASVIEDGTANLIYTFTRSGVTTNALTVNYTVGGTATIGIDYTGIATTETTKTVTFAAGSSTAVVIVDPTADPEIEPDETLALTLAPGNGYVIGTTTAVIGTISNDDFNVVSLAVSPASVTEDGTSNLIYTFSRTGSLTSALTVNYTVGGTATFGTDYSQSGGTSFSATTGTVTFAAGSATAVVTVDPTADSDIEVNETVALTLASGTGYTIGTTTAVIGTITNDDPRITLAVAPGSVTEDGTTNLVFTFSRTGRTTNPLTVNYTVSGSATLGTDFTGISSTPATKTITFAAGSATAIVTVDPTADTEVEANETVGLRLASGTGYTLGTTATVSGTITNDDFPSITLAVAPASVTEDGIPNLVYTFTRTAATTSALTVNYSVAGTATIGTDYTGIAAAPAIKTITFAAGSSTAVVIVDPTADPEIEPDETLALTLAPGNGYVIGTTTAVIGTISNDDFNVVSLAVSPASVTEDGTSNLIYTFSRTGSLTSALTVNYTVGGTATFGTDYSQSGGTSFSATTGTVTFAAGSATAVVTVDPTADSDIEVNETVALTLASGTGYTIGTTTAVIGTITNDDPRITLAVAPGSVTEDGTTNLVFTFSRTGRTTNPLTVNYTVSGSATLGTDFTGISSTPATKTITFAAGSATAIVTVDPTADTEVEANETVGLRLASGTGYTLGTTATVSGTITNDDLPVISLAVSPDATPEDGTANLLYIFTRTGVTTNALTVNYTVGGTATIGADYTGIATAGTTKTISFAAGSSTAAIKVDPTADTTVEADESVVLTLAPGTGYTIGAFATAAASILSDDQISVDINPPQLTSFDVISDSVVTSNQAQSIQVSLDAIDDFAGFHSASIVFTGPSGKQAISTTIYDEYDRISGNRLNGKYQKSLTLPRFSETGTWRLRDISLYDKSDKAKYLSGAIMAGLGFDLDFDVTGTSDTSSPDMVGLTINPGQLDISKNNAAIEVTVQVTDNLSGLQYLGITFVSPSGNQTLGNTIWADYDRVSGDGLNGVYKKLFTLPALSEPGTWKIREMSLYDNSNNGKYLTADQLTYPNVDHTFLVGIPSIQSNPVIGSSGNDSLLGTTWNDYIDGGGGADTLTGLDGSDIFAFRFGQSLVSGADRIIDFAIGTDKIELLTFSGVAMNAPTAFTRAANSVATTLANVVNSVFTDADGNLTGNNALGVNSAALINVTTSTISGTYLVINDGMDGFQSSDDLLVNITGYTGKLPALGNIAVGSFFV